MNKKLSDLVPSILALKTEDDVLQFSLNLFGEHDAEKDKVGMTREGVSVIVSKVDSMEKAMTVAIVAHMRDELMVEGLQAMEIIQQTETRLVGTSLLKKDKEMDGRGFIIVEKICENLFTVVMY